MKDTELTWKRQIKLEKTEILLYHKLESISTLHLPSPSFSPAGWCQEKNQFTALLPTSFTWWHTEKMVMFAWNMGESRQGDWQGCSCPCSAARSIDGINICAPLQFTLCHRSSVRSPKLQKIKNLHVSLYIQVIAYKSVDPSCRMNKWLNEMNGQINLYLITFWLSNFLTE